MANVKISDMTAKTGALDGDELLEIVSDPSGTPATRRITTTQVSDMALVSLDDMALGFSVDSVVSAVPGSPSEGDKHLVLDSGDAYEDEVIWYRNGAWVEYTPVHLNQVTDLATGYKYKYYNDRWNKLVDLMLTAVTTGSSGTLALDTSETEFPIMASSEIWDARVEVSCVIDTAGTAPENEATSGKWILDIIASRRDTGNLYTGSTINGATATAIAMTSIVTPSFVTAPTLTIDSSGEFKIDVVSSGTNAINWTATIKGNSVQGLPYTVPPS